MTREIVFVEEFGAFGSTWNKPLSLLNVVVEHLGNVDAQLFSVKLQVFVCVHVGPSNLLHLRHLTSVFVRLLLFDLFFLLFDSLL